MTIAAVSGPVQFPEIPASAEAAAKVINAAGGIAGHPIQIVACDEKSDPNAAAACARQAVSEKVTAVVGSVNGTGDTYIPILARAGIPEVAAQPTSQAQTTSPISFPITSTALIFSAGAAVLKAAGAASVQYLGPNVPAYAGLVQLTKSLLPSMGIAFHGSSTYPVTATDYTQYAAATYGAGAGGVYPILTAAGTLPSFINAVEGGGYSVATTPTVFEGAVFSPASLQNQLKGKLNGAYVVNSGQTPTDTSLPGIKTYHDELAASGAKVDFTDSGLEAWVGVHVIAQVLAMAAGDVTDPSVLIASMKAAGPINYPGWTPFDWSKPALPAPLATNFPRYFNATVWVSKIVDDQEVSAVSAPVPFSGPVTLTAK